MRFGMFLRLSIPLILTTAGSKVTKAELKLKSIDGDAVRF